MADEQKTTDNSDAFEIPPEQLVDILLRNAKLEQLPEDLLESATPEQIADALSRVSTEDVDDALRQRAERVADSFLDDARGATHRTDEEGFLTRHRWRWRESLLIARVFLDSSVELGQEINMAERPRAVEKQDAKFEALVRNHARICRIGKEALCLAANGYASGALARWRTMHEIAVVCLFLQQQPEEVSRRYLLYDAIDSLESAKAHDEHAEVLMCVRPTPEELEAVTRLRDALVEEFGPQFSKRYGWARGYVKEGPNFQALQKAVLPHWEPRYKFACQEVHAAAKPLYFNLSAGLQRDYLLVGPSDQGLPEALHPVLLSTNIVNACLVAEFPSTERTFSLLVLDSFANRAGEALLREFDNPGTAAEPTALVDAKPRVDYLKWSCDRLASMLESEHARRATIRRDAHASMFLLPILVGFGVYGSRNAEGTPFEIVLLCLLVAVAAAGTFCWYLAMRVKAYPAFNEEVFAQHDGTKGEHDYENRYLMTRDHLIVAVKDAKEMRKGIALWRRWCLRSAATAVALALILLVTRI